MYDVQRIPGLADLAEHRGGVVTRAECLSLGLSEGDLRWLLESGRWQSPFPRTLATFSGPIPRRSLEFAALAYAGPDAVLCRESAGAHWGLCPAPDVIHVGMPYPQDIADQPGLRGHRLRWLRPADVHPALEPRRLRIEPTVIDLLPRQRTIDNALGLVADAVRSRKTTAQRMRAAVEPRRRLRWRREVLLALPDIAAGAHSVLELHHTRLRRRHNLPPGRLQLRRRSDGVEFLDIVDDDYSVHTELDGRLGHDRARETWRDMRRDNRSEIGRLRHLRYGFADVLGRGCEVMVQEAVVLRQQGWTSEFRRCPSCPPVLPPDL
jgi:hypothetical protein